MGTALTAPRQCALRPDGTEVPLPMEKNNDCILIEADVAHGIWDESDFVKLWEQNSSTFHCTAELLSKPPSLVVLDKH